MNRPRRLEIYPAYLHGHFVHIQRYECNYKDWTGGVPAYPRQNETLEGGIIHEGYYRS